LGLLYRVVARINDLNAGQITSVMKFNDRRSTIYEVQSSGCGGQGTGECGTTVRKLSALVALVVGSVPAPAFLLECPVTKPPG
jgi:hypothetical protein